MNEYDVFHAITNVPDDLIDESRHTRLRQRIFSAKAWVAMAACLAIVIGAAYAGFRYMPVEIAHTPSQSSHTPADIIQNTASLSPLIKVAYPAGYAFGDHAARQQVQEQNPVDTSFSTAINTFSYQTAARILSGSDNQNYSPLSLYYALAVAATGAEGKTAEQFYDLLGVTDKQTLSTQCGNLYQQLYTDNKIGKLKIANSLWMDSSTPFHASFAQNAAEQFYASAFQVNFADPATSKAMGQWVADNTNAFLTPQFEPNPDQLLSILNTVYFYDEWAEPFKEDYTRTDTFYLANNQPVSCDFINGSDIPSRFAKGNGFTRASLSLKNGGEMVFVLPDEGVSLHDLIATPQQWQDAFESGEEVDRVINWQIPKFQFSSAFHDLRTPLQALGLTDAFQSNADFSAMTNGLMSISNVKQETRIGIDENGVTAAAFTEIIYCRGVVPPSNFNMILDRPFLYGIRSGDGTMLFMGICGDPTSSQ